MTVVDTAPVHYALFVGGAHVAASSPERIERRSPGSGRVVATYPSATEIDVARAVETAASALTHWRETPAAERSLILHRAADAFSANERRLAGTIAAEVGKSYDEAIAEVREGGALWRYAASALRAMHGESYERLGPDRRGFTLLEPVGVVALILPWNFPFVVSAERLPFILAAGCTVVAKPSEHAAGTAFQVGDILKEIGLPDGVYNVVSGFGATAGTALVSAKDVAMISFTGSSENGRRVMELASRTLKRVSLELGGKSPVIVFADADLDAAADGVVSGFTTNAGQCCIATSRLLLERSAAPELKARLLSRLDALGGVQRAATDAQHRRVAELVATGRDEAALLWGGEVRDSGVSPTVFDDVPPGSRLAKEEIFGPVLSIHYFDSEAEAIAMANDTEYGLAACVWSGDVTRAMRVARRIRAGRLWINSAQVNFPEMPVGGFGASGVGREAGLSGIRAYCEVKSVIMPS